MSIALLTTVHPRHDIRIFLKQANVLAMAYPEKVVLYVQDGQGDAEEKNGLRIIDTGLRQKSRISRMVYGSLKMFRMVRKDKPEVVHFHDPELIPVGILLKMFGSKVIYDVHENLPGQILSKPYIKSWLRPILSRAVDIVEHFATRYFDGVIVVTTDIASRFPSEKTVLVQNFPLLRELIDVTSDDYIKRPPNFAYVGGITKIRGIDEMLHALDIIKHDDVHLQMAGPFQPASLRHITEQMPSWKKVNYFDWVKRDEFPAFYNQVRAGMVLFHPVPNHLSAQPNKMFEYMSAGIPVIASDFPLWRQIIEEADCGLLVDPMDHNAIATAMNWILDNPEEAEAMGKRGQKAVREKYNWEAEAEKLVALYKTKILPQVENNR